MTKEQIAMLKAKQPGAIAFFRDGFTYKAYDKDAQSVYSVLMSRPMERLSNIESVLIKQGDFVGTIQKLVAAGKRVAIFEKSDLPQTVGDYRG